MLTNRRSDPDRLESVRVWASLLAAESRGQEWVRSSYVVPESILPVGRELEALRADGLICLIGCQGIGKSSALMAFHQGVVPGMPRMDSIVLKWRKDQDLHASFLESSRKTSHAYLYAYSIRLDRELESKVRLGVMSSEDRELLEGYAKDIMLLEEMKELCPRTPDIDWAESRLSKSTVSSLRRETCLQSLLETSLILIDTPDYSKTDRRRMATDLESIYALWSKIASSGGPTILFAVQKELSDGHFFLDKARKFEIEPLRAEQLVEAYRRKFSESAPFTEEALLKLARMSRGIFRRFLRYILLTLDLFENDLSVSEINADFVTRAVPVERIVEDMEVELSRLFPKNSGLTSMAVQLILLLEERGEMMQGEFTRLLDVEDYTLSRLLTKLEDTRYITRRREGNDKIVALRPRRTTQATIEYKSSGVAH